MAAGWRKQIPAESLLQLRQRLDRLPHKNPECAAQVRAMSELYGISTTSVYRALKDFLKPRVVHRTDHGKPRVLPKSERERYCERSRPSSCAPPTSKATTSYEVEPDMAGEYVLLLWGLFDNELYIEYEGVRTGPY